MYSVVVVVLMVVLVVGGIVQNVIIAELRSPYIEGGPVECLDK